LGKGGEPLSFSFRGPTFPLWGVEVPGVPSIEVFFEDRLKEE